MIGELECSGVGTPIECDQVKSVEELEASCARSNAELLSELREDEVSSELLRITVEDAKMGRMSEPELLEKSSTEGLLLNPRFGVVQRRPDGNEKVRAVDNFSWSAHKGDWEDGSSKSHKRAKKEHSVNRHTAASEKMSHDTLDMLFGVMKLFVATLGCVPGLFEADIDAAFRRIPVCSAHR